MSICKTGEVWRGAAPPGLRLLRKPRHFESVGAHIVGLGTTHSKQENLEGERCASPTEMSSVRCLLSALSRKSIAWRDHPPLQCDARATHQQNFGSVKRATPCA